MRSMRSRLWSFMLYGFVYHGVKRENVIGSSVLFLFLHRFRFFTIDSGSQSRGSTLTFVMPNGPQTSLDLTHVLCMPLFSILRIIITYTQSRPDDDSSLLSLFLALITLSPILLMVHSLFLSVHRFSGLT
jgi:hypothetical protein